MQLAEIALSPECFLNKSHCNLNDSLRIANLLTAPGRRPERRNQHGLNGFGLPAAGRGPRSPSGRTGQPTSCASTPSKGRQGATVIAGYQGRVEQVTPLPPCWDTTTRPSTAIVQPNSGLTRRPPLAVTSAHCPGSASVVV
jgi:hypothetical protein